MTSQKLVPTAGPWAALRVFLKGRALTAVNHARYRNGSGQADSVSTGSAAVTVHGRRRQHHDQTMSPVHSAVLHSNVSGQNPTGLELLSLPEHAEGMARFHASRA